MRRLLPRDIASREITPEPVYLARRQLLLGGAAAAGALLLPACSRSEGTPAEPGAAGHGEGAAGALRELPGAKRSPLSSTEEPTPYPKATRYNNFYEFGTDKEDPARHAGSLRPEPWSVVIEGLVARPGKLGLEDLLKPHPLEERVYRFRCVEAWSMVIPWIGIPLGDLLKRFEPGSQAKYVAFETLYDPEQMPGQRRRILDWPYVEGLRLDEAMHPLAILAVGMYGRVLPNQNGAPLRLVVPWKYGFKSIKSIVRIRLTEAQPPTTWNLMAPDEYGFYSNVNPDVDHPRWSQKRERRIGELTRRETLLMNGYADQVASLYTGMDLRRFF